MIIPQRSDSFVRLNPAVVVWDTTQPGAIGEQTIVLGQRGVKIPPLTAAIQVFAVVTSLAGGAASFVFLRHVAGGSDVALAICPVIGFGGGATPLLDFNGGGVTFRSDPGNATSYRVIISVTGFSRYA